jgi:hypothetical protein
VTRRRRRRGLMVGLMVLRRRGRGAGVRRLGRGVRMLWLRVGLRLMRRVCRTRPLGQLRMQLGLRVRRMQRLTRVSIRRRVLQLTRVRGRRRRLRKRL